MLIFREFFSSLVIINVFFVAFQIKSLIFFRKIINISSVHAYDPKRNFAHYSSSKGGLETLTKSLAMELAEFNIQVNSVVSGAIATEMTPAERCGKLLTAIPAGRIGAVEEIAKLVSFLSSNACDYLTGASIRVDGGLTLGFCASRPDL